LPKALLGILEAVAQGEITPGEGQALTAMLAAMVVAYEKGMAAGLQENRIREEGWRSW
jgi:hypothetical protein